MLTLQLRGRGVVPARRHKAGNRAGTLGPGGPGGMGSYAGGWERREGGDPARQRAVDSRPRMTRVGAAATWMRGHGAGCLVSETRHARTAPEIPELVRGANRLGGVWSRMPADHQDRTLRSIREIRTEIP